MWTLREKRCLGQIIQEPHPTFFPQQPAVGPSGEEQAEIVGWLLNVPATCECISGTDLHNFTCCHTEMLRIQLSISPSHSILTPGQPAPALTLWRQPLECQLFFLSHWYDSTPEKSRRKRGLNPGSSALEADAFTTRPMRRWATESDERKAERTLMSRVCWLVT